MNQEWFEMQRVRKRRLVNSVWIPLRTIHRIEPTGKYGCAGYREEFYGAGTIAIAIDAKGKAEKLGWSDIGTNGYQDSYVESGRYVPCDIYEDHCDDVQGVALALEQRGNSEEMPVWHLHQDIVIALRLKRENDVWLCPDEGYAEVARLLRYPSGKTYCLEVKAEYLRDYLCARSMALYVTSYRSREEVVEDASHITWEDNPTRQIVEGDVWEGHVFAIHEGGHPFGAKTGVFHAGRTDVDPEEDIPTFGFPTDDTVSSTSWTVEDAGKKLFRIRGEFWRNEWVDPAEYSPRIKRDRLPATVFFITDATGKKECRDTLVDAIRWLWFKPEVMMALAHRRGGSLKWYTRDTGNVKCSSDYDIHFGINKLGLINAFAKDIALLPEWQQRIWAGCNVSPEGGVSEELLASQMKAKPANTQAPEAFLSKAFSFANDAVKAWLGGTLFREHAQRAEIMRRTHRFRAVDQPGLFALAKDMVRLTAESIDTNVLQRIVSPAKKSDKWGSLKWLEKVLATMVPSEHARALLSPLVGIYELRHADAHLAGGETMGSLTKAGVDPDANPVHQGYQLIYACVSTLYEIADIMRNNKKSEL